MSPKFNISRKKVIVSKVQFLSILGNKGKYVALVADDDISLSPSMVDELLYGTKADTISINCDEDEVSVDAISVNQAEAVNKEDDEESVRLFISVLIHLWKLTF